MSDLLHLVVMLAAGGLLAAVWLAGLWLEVRRLPGRGRPYARLALGALVRLSLVAAGFYLIITRGGHWSDPLVALAGFVTARYLVTAYIRRTVRRPVEGDAS